MTECALEFGCRELQIVFQVHYKEVPAANLSTSHNFGGKVRASAAKSSY